MRAVLFPGALFASFPEPASAARLQAEEWRRFSDEEQKIIRDYFKSSATKVRAMADSGTLEPGAALAPGAKKRVLPDDLDALLPELDPEFDRVIVHGRVVLIEIHGEVIHDLVPGLQIA